MEKNIIRLLRADEIECRVSTINEKGLGLLLYKDARVDQKILDETFGPFGWQRRHQCIDGSLYCTVEIYDKNNGLWVAKQDVGTTGYAEKEKSQASDSFKRACFNWGIGRELYTAPFIWITADKTNIRNQEGRYYCSDHFSVSSINYNADREIDGITIANEEGKEVYKREPKMSGTDCRNGGTISAEQMNLLETELKRTGVGMEAVKGRYKFQNPEEMSTELYNKVMKALAKTKSVEAA